MNYAALLRGKDVFVEGVGFLGKVGDIELPKLSFKQTEVNGLKVDTGILEPLEAKVVINDFNDVLFEALGKRLKEVGLAKVTIPAIKCANSCKKVAGR